MSGEGENEGFLSRWSRRKREVVEAPQAEPPESAEPLVGQEPAAPETLPVARQAACPIPDVPDVDPATLPPVEELTAESDFSVFLKPGVPGLLRNAALRRMWSLDPAIRDYIGPVDYQWDFNTPGGLPFGFANELGGDVKKLLAQAIGKLEELAEEDGKPAAETEAAMPAIESGAPCDTPLALPEEAPQPEPLLADAPGARPAEPVHELDRPSPPRRRHGGALPA